MFADIPANYRSQTADNAEEGLALHAEATRKPAVRPELLTRDHVARCIVRRGQGGARQPARRRLPRHFVDQGETSERRGTHRKKAARACIISSSSSRTSTSPRSRWRSGPTTHYIMGGVRGGRRHADVQRAGACSPRGEVRRRVCNGANRLGGNSLSDLLVFGKRAGEFAAKFAKETRRGQIDERQIEEAARGRSSRSTATPAPTGGSEGPYQVQIDLQEMMQRPRGHRAAGGGDGARARGPGELVGALEEGRRSPAIANTTPAGTPPST